MYMCQVYAIELGFCSAAPFPLSPLDLNLDLPWEILLDLSLDLMWEIVLVPTILYDTMSVSSVIKQQNIVRESVSIPIQCTCMNHNAYP